MTTNTKTKKRPADVAAWHVVDAADKTLGRLASEIAVLLQASTTRPT